MWEIFGIAVEIYIIPQPVKLQDKPCSIKLPEVASVS
jgi:hypothetical protein